MVDRNQVDQNRLAQGNGVSFLNRNLILVNLSIFIFFFTFHSFLLLPIRIEELGGTESTIGFIMGAAVFATIFTTPAVGNLVDRWGKKWFLVVGGVLFSLTILPFAYITRLDYIYPLLRLLQGAAFSLAFISGGVLVADFAPASKRVQAIGLYGAFTILNHALAPFIGMILIDKYGFPLFFQFNFALSLLAFLVALFVSEQKTVDSSTGEGSGFYRVLLNNRIWVSALTLLITGYGFITTLIFIPVYARRIGIESFSYFYVAYSTAVIIERVFVGWVPDTIGKKRTVIPSLIFFAVSMDLLGFVDSLWDLVLAGVIFGLSHGFMYPTLYALVIDFAGEANRGKAVAICSAAFTGGGMLGSFINGVVAESYGFVAMFLSMGAISLIGFIVFAVFARESPKSTTSSV